MPILQHFVLFIFSLLKDYDRKTSTSTLDLSTNLDDFITLILDLFNDVMIR
jgi:hypothetical protein